jgi:hypothetical protein
MQTNTNVGTLITKNFFPLMGFVEHKKGVWIVIQTPFLLTKTNLTYVMQLDRCQKFSGYFVFYNMVDTFRIANSTVHRFL